MHDFFDKMPLVRGAFIRMQINLNAPCGCTVATSAGNVNSPSGVALTQGQAWVNYVPAVMHMVLPYQVSPLDNATAPNPQNGFKMSTQNNQTITTSLTVGNSYLKQTRMYIKQVQLAPETEKMYLSKLPSKRICYDEIFSYRFTVGAGGAYSNGNSANGTPFQQLITPSIARLRGMLIVPLAGQNGHVSAAGSTAFASPLSSPFSSAGATTLMNHQITQFNIQLGGQQWYSQNINYTWQQYLYETSKTGAFGGENVLSSGLISYSDYVNGMGFVYVDLSNGADEASDAKNKSVQISGICQTATPVSSVDYFVYLFYEKQIEINCSTGEIVFKRD